MEYLKEEPRKLIDTYHLSVVRIMNMLGKHRNYNNKVYFNTKGLNHENIAEKLNDDPNEIPNLIPNFSYPDTKLINIKKKKKK